MPFARADAGRGDGSCGVSSVVGGSRRGGRCRWRGGHGRIYDHKLGMGITGFVAETGECVMLPTCVCDAPDTHV